LALGIVGVGASAYTVILLRAARKSLPDHQK
jgi:hypothetical protein